LFRALWSIEKSFHMSESGRQARSVYHRTRDSIGAHLMIDGLRVALHTLRHGLNADGVASLVTQESGWIVRAAWQRRMMLCTQLANKNY
jgi:hypothetical protein